MRTQEWFDHAALSVHSPAADIGRIHLNGFGLRVEPELHKISSVAGNQSVQPVFVVVASLLGIVLAPILPCALTLLYYDLRVRREGFDIQVLSEQLGMGIH